MPCPVMFVGAILVGKPELSPIYWLIKLKDGDFNHFKENTGSLILSTTITIVSWKAFTYVRRKYFLGHKEENNNKSPKSGCPAERFLPSFLFIKPKTQNEPDHRNGNNCPLGFGRNTENPRVSGGCPLGFGSNASVSKPDSKAELPLFVLWGHKDLVSVKGWLFDLSAGEKVEGGWTPFPEGDKRLKLFRGHDISRALALDSTSREYLDQGLAGLGFEQLQRLESWYATFTQNLPVVGRLAGADYEKIFGHAWDQDLNEEKKDTTIHEAIETSNIQAVRQCLEHCEDKESIVNKTCPRTGLSALHKAIEVGDIEMVKLLVKSGASLEAKAQLYDDDTPIQLAKRLKSKEIVAYLLTENVVRQGG